MANEEHINLIKQGVDAWNAWREKNPEIHPDLSQMDLRGSKLQKINFSRSNLRECKLQFSNLASANLEGANLTKSKLQETCLQNANMLSCDLSGAGMLESNLQYTNLENANLEGVQFNEDTLLNQTNLKGANLLLATGLSTSQLSQVLTDKKTQLPDYLEEEMDDDFLLQF
jgi:uncharacterized protein YjbI with pentapeptide repeats